MLYNQCIHILDIGHKFTAAVGSQGSRWLILESQLKNNILPASTNNQKAECFPRFQQSYKNDKHARTCEWVFSMKRKAERQFPLSSSGHCWCACIFSQVHGYTGLFEGEKYVLKNKYVKRTSQTSFVVQYTVKLYW